VTERSCLSCFSSEREREREREECLSVCVVVYKCEAKFMKSTLSRYGVGVMLSFGPRMMGFVLF
jgi:hypothetical protein